MSIVGTMWGVGLIIGPAIGGYLAQESLHTHNTSVKKVSEGFSSIEKNSNGQSEAKEDDKQISKGEVQGGQRQLWKNRGFIAAVSLNAVWVVHGMSYAEIFPLWACSPKMYGGIAFTTSEVANVLALSGTSMLLFQLFFFSPLIRAFGTIECLRAFMFLTVPLTAIYPLIARFHGIVLWILLVLVSAGKNVLSSANFTGTFILVNNSVVKAQRGIANGFSTSVMSFFQAVGPACAGALFSWSEEREDASFLPGMWMVFSILSALSFLAFLTTFEHVLPNSLNQPIQ